MDPWVWAALLLLLGLALVAMEVFIPSGGILGFLAICSVVGAVVMAFNQGPGVGMTVLGMAIFGFPVVIILALKYWPHTAIGRRIFLLTPSSEDVLPNDARRETLRSLVGRVGKAKTKMLPSGAVVIDRRTIDAVSEGTPIEAGAKVRVTEVRGNRVVVRAIGDEPPSEADRDPLARPIDTVASDPFEDPRA